MGWAVGIATGTASTGTVGTTQDFVDTANIPSGMPVVAAIIFCSRAAADDTEVSHGEFAIGMANTTEQLGYGVVWEHDTTNRNFAGTLTGSGDYGRSDKCLIVPAFTTIDATEFEMSRDSFITQGVRLKVEKQSAVGRKLCVILFAGNVTTWMRGVGSEITASDNVPVGFNPDGVMLVGIGETEYNTGVGFAARRGVSGIEQASFSWNANDAGLGSMELAAYASDANIWTMLEDGGLHSTPNIQLGWASNGLDLPFVGARGAMVMAFKGDPELQLRARVITTPTSTGNVTYDGLGFSPIAGLHVLSFINGLNSLVENNFAGAAGLHAWVQRSASFDDESVMMYGRQVNSPVNRSDSIADGALRLRSHPSAGVSNPSITGATTAVTADGYTVNYSEANAVARRMVQFVMGRTPKVKIRGGKMRGNLKLR